MSERQFCWVKRSWLAFSFFQHFENIIHSLLERKVSIEKCTDDLIWGGGLLLYERVKILSLSLFSESFIIMCLEDHSGLKF